MVFCNKNSGFTLIEVAIALTIVGILLAGFFKIFLLVNERNVRIEYFGEISAIRDALEDYVLTNGFYPAPAALNLAITDVNYGLPVDQEAPPRALPDIGAGECALNSAAINGVFCTPGTRDLDSNGIGEDNEEVVLIGSVPTTILGFNPEESLDQFGQRYTYAVSRGLTQSGGFTNSGGVLRVLSSDSPGNNALSTNRDVHYVLVAHGTNHSGSYNALGNLSTNLCPSNDAMEIENCDNDSVFQALTAGDENTPGSVNIQNQLSTNEVTGNYFDDAVIYSNSILGRFWTARGATQINITSGATPSDANVVLGNTTYTGSINNVNDRTQLWIDGDSRSDRVITKRLCRKNQNECFRVEDIVSTAPVLNDISGNPKQLKCVSRGFNNVTMQGTSSGRKPGREAEANGDCDVITKVTSPQFGTQDSSGIICVNGADGVNPDGTMRCL